MGDMDSGGGEGARDVVRLPGGKRFHRTARAACGKPWPAAAARWCWPAPPAGGWTICCATCTCWNGLEGQGAHGYVVDGGNVAQILRPGVVQVPAQFRYFSLIPLDPVLAGVDIRGAKYPLQNATVRRDDSLCISNEALGQVGGDPALPMARPSSSFQT